MPKISKKVQEQRIQRAVNGLIIPILRIPAMNKFLEGEIATGMDDETLARSAKNWLTANG